VAAIVMLHGWGMHPAVFDRLAPTFAPHAAHALALPGYDGTSAVSPYELDDLALELAARAPRKCVVAGWSLGAQVALAWARARPQQVERLVLLSATPCFVQRDDWPAAMAPCVFDAFSDAVRIDPVAALRRFVSLQVEGDAAAKRVAHALRSALSASPAPQAQVLEGGLRILREADLRGVLGEIETRALVLHGEHDRLVPPAAAEYLAHALPRAILALVPRAAHAPFAADPAGVGRRVLEFLDER
jgi:pimeloyl-[acyl-carrier protein] methyl ester esterase